jgi:hypothetical protein
MYTLQGETRTTHHTLPRSVRVWSRTIRISRGPHIATLHTVVNNDEQSHCSQEKRLLTQSTAWRSSNPRVHTQFLSRSGHWSSEGKTTLCWWQTTRLTGPITPSCDWYVQYLLAGANPLVINWHRWRLQSWRCRLSTYHSLTVPTDGLHFSPKGPIQSSA